MIAQGKKNQDLQIGDIIFIPGPQCQVVQSVTTSGAATTLATEVFITRADGKLHDLGASFPHQVPATATVCVIPAIAGPYPTALQWDEIISGIVASV